MQFRNNILIGLVCLVFAGTISLLFLFGYQALKFNAEKLEAANEELARNISLPIRQSKPRVAVGTRRESIETAKRLRQLLEERTKLYRQQKNQLVQRIDQHDHLQMEYRRLTEDHDKLQKQYNKLWREADASLLMLADLLQQEGESFDQPGLENRVEQELGVDNGGENEVSENAETESDLRIDLAVSEWELEQARQQILELEASEQRESRISTTASMALIEIGEPVVPLLAELLTDDGPELRAWAAGMIGNIGSTNPDVLKQLGLLAQETNSDVASAAQNALAKIESDR